MGKSENWGVRTGPAHTRTKRIYRMGEGFTSYGSKDLWEVIKEGFSQSVWLGSEQGFAYREAEDEEEGKSQDIRASE